MYDNFAIAKFSFVFHSQSDCHNHICLFKLFVLNQRNPQSSDTHSEFRIPNSFSNAVSALSLTARIYGGQTVHLSDTDGLFFVKCRP